MSDREKNLHQRTQTCRHFNGIQHDTCEVGIPYSTVKDASERPFRYPCIHPDCAVKCDSASYYTREEAEAREREVAEIIQRIAVARTAIVKATGGKRGLSGEIPCPCCDGGIIDYTVAGSNGHIWANCSTKGCVRWME